MGEELGNRHSAEYQSAHQQENEKGMWSMGKLIAFLNRLESSKIYYTLNKVRDSILVEVVVPGERWEVEFFENGTVEIEKFLSNGQLYREEEIEKLIANFRD